MVLSIKCLKLFPLYGKVNTILKNILQTTYSSRNKLHIFCLLVTCHCQRLKNNAEN